MRQLELAQWQGCPPRSPPFPSSPLGAHAEQEHRNAGNCRLGGEKTKQKPGCLLK